MMIRAVKADEIDLEASALLSSAIERVNRFEAQDEAIAKLIPLLDVTNNSDRMRTRFCILYLDARSPGLVAALIAIYRNPLAPWWDRMEIAGLLTSVSPQDAQKCGAAAALNEYLARRTDPMNGVDQRLLAEEVLRGEDAHRRSHEAKREKK